MMSDMISPLLSFHEREGEAGIKAVNRGGGDGFIKTGQKKRNIYMELCYRNRGMWVRFDCSGDVLRDVKVGLGGLYSRLRKEERGGGII